jgi:predicted metal-dependent hydrolase
MRSATNLGRIKDIRNEGNILFGTTERKRSLAGTAYIWKVQIKTDLQKSILQYRLDIKVSKWRLEIGSFKRGNGFCSHHKQGIFFPDERLKKYTPTN